MTDPKKLTAFKKAYADIILNTTKEAAARVMISEKKARGYQLKLASVRDEALRICIRLKHMYDSKVQEAEMISLNKQQKIEELEAQLGEAEDIVGDLRIELGDSQYLVEKLTNGRQTNLSNKEKIPNEAVSLKVCEDSSNHESSVFANKIKILINRCSYKENQDPNIFPSILNRHKEPQALERNMASEENENNTELSTTAVSPSEKPCIKYKLKRKHKKDGRSSSNSSPEGGDSSSQDDDESRNKRQKTGEKDNTYLDSFTCSEPFRDSRRVAQVARQLLPFTEKKVLQQSQCDDVP